MLLIPLLVVMLLLACVASFLSKFYLKRVRYRVMFFLLGGAIPVVDVPYTQFLHNRYCSGQLGLIQYEQITEPQKSVYIEKPYRISRDDSFFEVLEFIEHYDPRTRELWMVKKVNGELQKESIEHIESTYQYVDKGRRYEVDYAIEKNIIRQVLKLEDLKVVSEVISYTNTKHLGWFFSTYYDSGSSCELGAEVTQLLIQQKKSLSAPTIYKLNKDVL